MTRQLIIIGSGAAGMLAALEAVSHGVHPVLLTKAELGAGNTGEAQGGLSALTALGISRGDSVQAHVSDTLSAGAGHCAPRAVSTLCQDSPDLVTRLEALGVHFDRDPAKNYQLGLEAAHSAHRILHIGGDATGKGLVNALGAACRSQQEAGALEIIDHAMATELCVREGRVSAVRYLRDGQQQVRSADAVLVATGGIGQLYQSSTNPAGATGDGIALAARAGAAIADLEFVQFHPTMVDPVKYPGAGMISEAVRGEGAWLINDAGERFMLHLDDRAELAPRDVIARAIHAQTLDGHQVFLDARHVETTHGDGFLAKRFPSITGRLAACGLDLATEPIPVAPAQHYLMGGVLTDLEGRSTLPGLYAAGECANSRVHGANRLASNSLLDAMVFARRAIRAMLTDSAGQHADLPPTDSHRMPPARSVKPIDLPELQRIATQTLAVYREAGTLQQTIARLDASTAQAADERALAELENLLLVARLIAHAALARTQSLGAHYRVENPEPQTGERTSWQLSPTDERQHTDEAKEIFA